MADNADTADTLIGPKISSINAPSDPRVTSARLAFGADVALFINRTTVVLRNYLLDGKLIQVALYSGGRIEQRDTASHVAKISNLTIKITVNGMPFEIDQHSILSTPNDLIYTTNGSKNQVQVLQMLDQKLQSIDTIAMVHFKHFLNTGIVDTSKGQSVLHMGPSKAGYKLSIQIACLRLAVTLQATRFLTHLIKEIEYVWLAHDLSLSQLLASVQAAPYLNNLLVVWTFAMPAQNLAQKDCLINSALANLPHYRNLVRQHAARYADGPMMPSGKHSELDTYFQARSKVKEGAIFTVPICKYRVSDDPIVRNFLIRIGDMPNTNSMTPQPSSSDTSSTLAPVGLATPSTESGNVEEDATNKDSQVLIGKQPRSPNGGQE